MAGNEKKRKKMERNPEYPLLLAGLTAARTPRAPREVCAVFGCRSSSLDGVEFRPLPTDPESLSTWLKLINRQDLSSKPVSGARVCSLHFAPAAAAPSLLLPTTAEFVPAGLPDIVKAECAEVKFEPEYPPAPEPEPIQPHVDLPGPNVNTPWQNVLHTGPNVAQQTPNIHSSMLNILPGSNVFHPGPNVNQQSLNVHAPILNLLPMPNVLHSGPNVDQQTNVPMVLNILPGLSIIQPTSNVNQPTSTTQVAMETQSVNSASIKSLPEPKYLDSQVHMVSQTDSGEALQRLATYSAVEQVNIPPSTRRVVSFKQNSVESQTSDDLTEYFTRGIKTRLGAELEEAEKKLEMVENPHLEKTQFIRGCDKYLDEKIANFIQSHAYLCDKFQGDKYPESFKTFALKLYLQNPTSYKFVERFFNLPSKRTIHKFKYPVKTGISECLMEFFKVKVEKMSVQEKMCVVCFDVIPLRRNLYYDVTNDYLCGMEEIDQVCGTEPAEYAAVVSVRGLYNHWKQPVSFAFLSQRKRILEVKTWLVKTIHILLDMGLQVKALVTNPDDEFAGLTVNEDVPYFEVSERKIYHIFDVPHLFKKARDQLMQYDFHIGAAVVKWDHVLSVYDSDKEQDLRLMSNITENHVRPDTESQNNLMLATQVFSNSVAAAMHFYFVARIHSKETKSTVQFITKMSNLLDILYSRTLAEAYRGSASQQRLLKEMIEYLKGIKVRDDQRNTHENIFASGLIITIKSMMALITDLKKCNVKYILTKNLSKDFMQTFFDDAKRLSNCERLTPIKFARAFRKLFFINLLNNTKQGATGKDMNVSLVQVMEYVKVDIDKKPEPEEQIKGLAIGVNDYRIRWPSNEYIAGYLLCKCLEKHSCHQLIEKLCGHYKFAMQDNPELLIKTFQLYNSKNVDSTFMKKPPPQLTEYVGVMEKRFDEYFARTDKNYINFGWSVYAEMENDFFLCPCICFPLKFMKMLYIRLKIYDALTKYKSKNK